MARTDAVLVEVYPFRFRKDEVEYLLLQRAENDDLYPGIWQIVTGGILPGESAVAAARRELLEETGHVPLRMWTVPMVETFYHLPADSAQLVPLFACQLDDAVAPVLSGEHHAFRWLSLRSALPLLAWPGQRAALEVVHRCIASGDQAMTLLAIS